MDLKTGPKIVLFMEIFNKGYLENNNGKVEYCFAGRQVTFQLEDGIWINAVIRQNIFEWYRPQPKNVVYIFMQNNIPLHSAKLLTTLKKRKKASKDKIGKWNYNGQQTKKNPFITSSTQRSLW